MKVNVPHIEPLHSPEWVSMRPALENKPILRQAVVPHSTPGDDPAFYEYDNKTFLLPQVDQKQFNLWGLDPQRFIQDMMTTNPGRIKELSKSQIVEAAGRFAKLRFPGAHLGLDKQFIKQFRTPQGIAALTKHDNERRAVIAEDRAFTPILTSNLAILGNELRRQRSGMFGDARKSEQEVYRGVIKREKELSQGIPREDAYQPGIVSTDMNYRILRAHPLSEASRVKLASSGLAIIVSLPSLEEQAASTTTTHFHIHPTEPNVEDIWVKLELLTAFHPAVVIPFDNVTVKDRALAQLQHSARFNFLEEKRSPA